MSEKTLYSPRNASEWPLSPSGLSRLALETPDMELRYYTPKGFDSQTPHDRDELYVVISGRGYFERRGRTIPFVPGDALFVGAGEQHRFTDFGDDFATWVIFIGPKKK
jgi:mannose-6-phosphate isomerase-like protein (cupin superfamily)